MRRFSADKSTESDLFCRSGNLGEDQRLHHKSCRLCTVPLSPLRQVQPDNAYRAKYPSLCYGTGCIAPAWRLAHFLELSHAPTSRKNPRSSTIGSKSIVNTPLAPTPEKSLKGLSASGIGTTNLPSPVFHERHLLHDLVTDIPRQDQYIIWFGFPNLIWMKMGILTPGNNCSCLYRLRSTV